ncbi:MAG: hypothetical protein U9R06_03615 [Patescibacteria group bacterium]|nr:hypothetical protein [Patescibacteria group bacterium]
MKIKYLAVLLFAVLILPGCGGAESDIDLQTALDKTEEANQAYNLLP